MLCVCVCGQHVICSEVPVSVRVIVGSVGTTGAEGGNHKAQRDNTDERPGGIIAHNAKEWHAQKHAMHHRTYDCHMAHSARGLHIASLFNPYTYIQEEEEEEDDDDDDDGKSLLLRSACAETHTLLSF